MWTFPRCSHSLFEFRLPWGVLCSRSPLAEIQRGSLEWARCIEIPGINGTIEVGPCMREYSWTLDMESSMVSKVFQGWLNYHCQFSWGFGGCLLDVKYGLVGSCFMINHPSWRSIIHRILAFDYLSCGVVSPGPMNLIIMWWLGRGKFANASYPPKEHVLLGYTGGNFSRGHVQNWSCLGFYIDFLVPPIQTGLIFDICSPWFLDPGFLNISCRKKTAISFGDGRLGGPCFSASSIS